jgi:hypothetical protein
MPKGELQFHIEEATGLSGEAVETLALVLADVAAMMCSCQGIGHHPRFLLHDSPREADLERHIYSRYLRFMWNLTNHFGCQDKAPFQYIVTTTSKPPKELEAAICLRLEAHPKPRCYLDAFSPIHLLKNNLNCLVRKIKYYKIISVSLEKDGMQIQTKDSSLNLRRK